MPKDRPKRDRVTQTLRNLDLGENEAALYAVMLGRPESTVQELGVRTPFPRTLLYHVLKQLMRRGLVSARKASWRTVYVAENPERLHELLAQKEREFKREADGVRSLIPRLKHQYQLSGRRPNVRLFDGVEEYQKALEDVILSKPSIVLAYETPGDRKPAVETREAHERKRIARKIQKRVLFFDTPSAKRALTSRHYDDFTQFRSVKDGSVTPFSTEVALYDGKILYTSSYGNHEPTAVLIEDKGFYEMQKRLFEAFWKQAKDQTLAYSKKP